MTKSIETTQHPQDQNFQEKQNNSSHNKYTQFILLIFLLGISIIGLIIYIKQTNTEQNNKIEQKI